VVLLDPGNHDQHSIGSGRPFAAFGYLSSRSHPSVVPNCGAAVIGLWLSGRIGIHRCGTAHPTVGPCLALSNGLTKPFEWMYFQSKRGRFDVAQSHESRNRAQRQAGLLRDRASRRVRRVIATAAIGSAAAAAGLGFLVASDTVAHSASVAVKTNNVTTTSTTTSPTAAAASSASDPTTTATTKPTSTTSRTATTTSGQS
jgi:hypothetical protein